MRSRFVQQSLKSLFQFLCPTYSSALTRLRFGDHDRLAHPTDCSKFYACLLNGQPRVGSCPAPLVFDVTSGFCTHYKKVKSCETFYDHLRQTDDAVSPLIYSAPPRNVPVVADPAVLKAQVIFDAPVGSAPVIFDAPARSAPAGTGSKNFFNFQQRN